jgi:hypothetical protein
MTTHLRLAGKHIVVTGFTGFLAKVVVAMLLEQIPELGRITLLVRPRGRLQNALVRTERIVDTTPVFRSLRTSTRSTPTSRSPAARSTPSPSISCATPMSSCTAPA